MGLAISHEVITATSINSLAADSILYISYVQGKRGKKNIAHQYFATDLNRADTKGAQLLSTFPQLPTFVYLHLSTFIFFVSSNSFFNAITMAFNLKLRVEYKQETLLFLSFSLFFLGSKNPMIHLEDPKHCPGGQSEGLLIPRPGRRFNFAKN